VSGYASRLHAAAGERHQVASALGAWLLLALAAPASSGADRAQLTNVLGCEPDAAARYAADLLGHPHPVVAGAAAVWTRPDAPLGDAFRRWQRALPAAVQTGDLPSQPALDAWARDHTLGLIDRFPVDARQAFLVLATALATKVSWQVPFALTSAASLGSASEWARTLGRVLRTPNVQRGQGHRQFIGVSAETSGARVSAETSGARVSAETRDVAVHAAAAQDGLVVYSVAAAPDVPYLDVLAAAHRIACADAIGAAVEHRDLRSLPLGDGPAWSLREELARSPADVCIAVLPAWSARSQHDLARAGLGFGAAAAALAPGAPWTASQAAMAKYSRTGFEAAAVTATAMRAAALEPHARRRVAELRFGHPYAVVAVATGTADAGDAAWHGVPVFSAWVTEPEDAADEGNDAAERRL